MGEKDPDKNIDPIRSRGRISARIPARRNKHFANKHGLRVYLVDRCPAFRAGVFTYGGHVRFVSPRVSTSYNRLGGSSK